MLAGTVAGWTNGNGGTARLVNSQAGDPNGVIIPFTCTSATKIVLGNQL